MFTGLIQEVGRVTSARAERGGASASSRAVRLDIEAPGICGGAPRDPLSEGESVAVNGCCLTVETRTDRSFTAFASSETLAKSTLGALRPGDAVNLERALLLGDRIGGHLVSGHVDGVGRTQGVRQAGGGAWELRFDLPEALANETVLKGSITIDGVSLTVAELAQTIVTIVVVPETHARTTLRSRRVGDRVNVETDLIGKHVARQVERIMGPTAPQSGGLDLRKL